MMVPLAMGKEFSPQFAVPLMDQITEFLTGMIIEGQIEGGQRLVENELQRRFGVSRAPIRESFRILEKNGLVITFPRKGTFVRKITQKDIEENFPIRASLESLAARMAISHLTSEDIERMKSSLSQMTNDANNKDLKSYLKHNAEYHDIFINASQNAALIGILENLRRQAMWYRFSYLYLQESFEYSLSAHREILDLIVAKDIKRLEVLVKEHIMVALHKFLRLLQERELSAGK